MIDFSKLIDRDFTLIKAVAPPSFKEIRDVRDALHVSFPIKYLDFLAVYGAVYLSVNEKVWPKPKEYETRPYWEMMSAVMLLGMPSAQEKKDFPDMLNIVAINEIFQQQFRQDMVPFFKWEGAATISCFLKSSGRIFNVHYDHPQEPEPVEQDFEDFFSGQVRLLAERKNEYKTKYDVSGKGNDKPAKKKGFWSGLFGSGD
jgi:hypothetical protein